MTAWKHASRKSRRLRVGFRSSNTSSSHDSNVRWRFFLMPVLLKGKKMGGRRFVRKGGGARGCGGWGWDLPGGDSNVAFNDCCNKIEGKLLCASEVNHNRKSLFGSNEDNSFSNDGSQAMTKCRFLRHNHDPFFAAVRNICIAVSCWPPPMANSS